MSTSSHLVCVSHDPPIHGDSIDRGHDALMRVVNHGPLSAQFWYTDVRDPETYINVAGPLNFLAEHAGCFVWICNEYGDWTHPRTGFTHQEVIDTTNRPGFGTRTGICTCGAPHPHVEPWRSVVGTPDQEASDDR